MEVQYQFFKISVPVEEGLIPTKISKEKEGAFIPKFFFEISKDIEFYTNDEFLEYVDICLKNLQIVFKLSKQKCFDCFRKNEYNICDTLNELHEASEEKNEKSENFKNPETNQLFCSICLESKHLAEFFSFECFHKFCRECFQNYLNSSLNSHGFLFFNDTKCPMEGCNVNILVVKTHYKLKN